MTRLLEVLVRASILGTALGSGVAALGVSGEHYIEHGLLRLALGVWADALSAYLIAALAGALLALLVASLARLAGLRPDSFAGRVAELTSWLAAFAPLALMVDLRDPGLLPRDERFVLAGYALLALAGLHFATRWLRARWKISGGRRLLRAIAATCAILAAAVLVGQRLPSFGARDPKTRPNILLIVLDTVRADRVSAFGYARLTTPQIDAFASDAIRFPNFYATSSWTVPSHASLFTGLYAVTHRANQERMRLDGSFATLAEILRNAGYQTWAASGNPWLGRGVNLTQGFQSYVETWRHDLEMNYQYVEGDPHPVNVAFERFLERKASDRPFFAFINYMDAHMPYSPPEPYLSRFLDAGTDPHWAYKLGRVKWSEYYRGRPYTERDLEVLSDLYDGNLAFLSSAVGRLLRTLEGYGYYDDTLIVITADHGELFGESGHFGDTGLLGHMFGLYNGTVRVPLIIRLPGGLRSGEVDDRKGQLVDLFPTILGVAGVDAAGFEHRGLDLLAEERGPTRESIFSEYYHPDWVFRQFTPEELERQDDKIQPFRRRLRAVQRYGFRLIWSSNGRHELYDLRVDPMETRNLLEPENRTALADEFFHMLLRELEAYAPGSDSHADLAAERGSGRGPADVDEETLEALREVGYVR